MQCNVYTQNIPKHGKGVVSHGRLNLLPKVIQSNNSFRSRAEDYSIQLRSSLSHCQSSLVTLVMDGSDTEVDE